MDKINKILLALDGSKESKQALGAAKTSAIAHGAQIIVFGCLNLNELSATPEFNPASIARAMEKAEQNLLQHLEDVAKELREDGIEASVLISKGKPTRAIIEAAEGRNVDLIVMASHGRSGLRRMFVGSVTEGVLRQARRPLLVYPVKE